MNNANCTRNMIHILAYGRILVCALLTISLSVLASNEAPELPDHDLDIIEQNRHGEFLVTRDVDWSQYSQVQLEISKVEFRDRWIHDQRWRSGNIIREKDEARIKAEMADLVSDVLGRELPKKGGYAISDESGADVMRMTIRVVNLDIVAPDRVRNHIGFALTDSQLNMTLELDVYDSLSGNLLATSWRHLEDPYKGYIEWTTSVTNKRAAQLMLERWSTWLTKQFDEARAESLNG